MKDIDDFYQIDLREELLDNAISALKREFGRDVKNRCVVKFNVWNELDRYDAIGIEASIFFFTDDDDEVDESFVEDASNVVCREVESKFDFASATRRGMITIERHPGVDVCYIIPLVVDDDKL